MNKEQIKGELRRWVAMKNGKVTPESLTDRTPIIEQRILSSLHVMELLLLIERLSGKPVEVDRLQPGSFRDIETIYQSFFHEPGGAHALA